MDEHRDSQALAVSPAPTDVLARFGRLGLSPSGVEQFFGNAPAIPVEPPMARELTRLQLRSSLLRADGNGPELRATLAQFGELLVADRQEVRAHAIARELAELSTAASDAIHQATAARLDAHAWLGEGVAAFVAGQFDEAATRLGQAEAAFALLGERKMQWLAFRKRSMAMGRLNGCKVPVAAEPVSTGQAAAQAPALVRQHEAASAMRGAHVLRRVWGALRRLMPRLS